MLSKNVYYIIAKDGLAYQMCPLIYDVKSKPEVETTQALAWISFPDLLAMHSTLMKFIFLFFSFCIYS